MQLNNTNPTMYFFSQKTPHTHNDSEKQTKISKLQHEMRAFSLEIKTELLMLPYEFIKDAYS